MFSYPRWDFFVFLSKMRLSGFLIQDKTFWFSYPRWDFLVFLSKMRLSGFLIQDKTFRILIQHKTFQISHPRWEIDEITAEKEKEKAHTKTAPVYAVKKTLHRYTLSYRYLSITCSQDSICKCTYFKMFDFFHRNSKLIYLNLVLRFIKFWLVIEHGLFSMYSIKLDRYGGTYRESGTFS